MLEQIKVSEVFVEGPAIVAVDNQDAWSLAEIFAEGDIAPDDLPEG